MSQPSKAHSLDVRAWLDQARALGKLKEVPGADWDLGLCAISELNVKKERASALLFDDIPGYPNGFRVATCTTANPARLASILRIGGGESHKSLVQTLRGKPKRWQSEAPGYDPVVVDNGPVFENVQSGGDVDLFSFPSPLWHEKDGGRHIGTGCMVVTKDLDSDWINVGTYRVMIHDRNHVGLDMIPGKHGAVQYDKRMKAGKPFPVSIVIGCDPLGYFVSGIEVRFGVCELNYVGATLGQPVEVVCGEPTGLPFPGASEIVIEGYAHPVDVRIEGPLGEFHGDYPGNAEAARVVKIERICYSNQPIIMGGSPAKPPNDYSYSKAVMRSAPPVDALQAAGVANVEGVWATRSAARTCSTSCRFASASRAARVRQGTIREKWNHVLG